MATWDRVTVHGFGWACALTPSLSPQKPPGVCQARALPRTEQDRERELSCGGSQPSWGTASV